MTISKLLPALAAAALLTACDARFGNEAGEVAENATAAGRAEEGRLTVEAPGFNMSINIPEKIRTGIDKDHDNELIYPGSRFGGIHVQAIPKGAVGEADGEVEMRFSTADNPDRVFAWYRDPARGKEIRIVSAGREGEDFVIAATGGDDGRISIRISPRAGGGSEARLLLSER